jgi:hypothetical protein
MEDNPLTLSSPVTGLPPSVEEEEKSDAEAGKTVRRGGNMSWLFFFH